MTQRLTINGAGARECTAVTKSDVTTYSPMFDALYVGGAGNVTIVDGDGNTVEFVGVPAGTILPVNAYQVMDATTATSIVGLRY